MIRSNPQNVQGYEDIFFCLKPTEKKIKVKNKVKKIYLVSNEMSEI